MSEMNVFLSKLKEFFGAEAESEVTTFLQEMNMMVNLLESRISEMQPGKKPENLDETLRTAHTIKGMTAQFGLPGMSQIVHRLEDSLIPFRDQGALPQDALITLGLQAIDRLKGMLEDLREQKRDAVLSDAELVARLVSYKETQGVSETNAQEPVTQVTTGDGSLSPPLPSTQPAEIASIQVPINLLDQLFAQLGKVSQSTQSSPSVSSQVNEALWTLVTARMLPPDSIVTRLRRTLRETAPKLGKKVKLIVSGETEPVDVSLVRELGEMLLHMLRNSLDHGLELPEDRQNHAKDPEGTIALKFVKSPEMVRVEISDDGRGMDPSRIATKAIEKGIITSEQNDRLTNYERLRLIFAPGFSTAAQVTEVSGRGVGMDVVLKSATKLGGTVEVESDVGQGTRFVMKFPVRYYCVPSILCRIGTQRFALNVENIERVMTDRNSFKIEDGALVCTEYEGEMIPLIGFPDLDAKLWDTDRTGVVLFGFDGIKVAMAFDEILDARPTILAPLPKGTALAYLNSAMFDPEYGAVFGFNLDEIRRNWNSYMIPEKLPDEPKLPQHAVEQTATMDLILNEPSNQEKISMNSSLAERVKSALDEIFCQQQMQILLNETSDPGIQMRTREYFSSQRSEFLSVVEDVGEGDDLGMVLATRYVELKAHWIQLNIQLQYQSIMKGEADQGILCRAACLSFLLGQIEPLIDSQYLSSINRLLTQDLTGTEEKEVA